MPCFELCQFFWLLVSQLPFPLYVEEVCFFYSSKSRKRLLLHLKKSYLFSALNCPEQGPFFKRMLDLYLSLFFLAYSFDHELILTHVQLTSWQEGKCRSQKEIISQELRQVLYNATFFFFFIVVRRATSNLCP